eukprot:Colp12_sorted_trinity150504_noHs@15851
MLSVVSFGRQMEVSLLRPLTVLSRMPLRAMSHHAKTSAEAKEPLVKVEHDLDSQGQETGVVVVTFNNPSTLNALTQEMGLEFQRHMKQLEANKSLRAVVLTGAGRAFSAGGDIGFLEARKAVEPDENAQVMHRFYNLFLSVRKVPVPVIAAINGPAIGAGFCLALACDIRLASSEAKMGLNFVRLGLTPGMGGTHTLAAITNPAIASRLILTGDVVHAQEAHSMGLISEVTEAGVVAEKAITMARRIAQASPFAVRSSLAVLRKHVDNDLERALWTEADLQAQCYTKHDFAEGIASIKEKRIPLFNNSA